MTKKINRAQNVCTFFSYRIWFNSNNKSPSSSLSPNDVGGMNGINSVLSNNIGLSAFTTMLPNLDDRSKKSQNMTECVPVPSSEHVAEIVGRQGNLIIHSAIFILTHHCGDGGSRSGSGGGVVCLQYYLLRLKFYLFIYIYFC